jgi:hypothetical protein
LKADRQQAGKESPVDERIERLIARQEIEDCIFRYMRGQDRLDAELQRSAFHPDATVDYGFWKGEALDFVDFAQGLLTRYGATQHLIGQTHIVVTDGERGHGEVYFIAYSRRFADGGAEEDLIIAGRYLDGYERRDGAWRIATRTEVVDWTHTASAADDWFHRIPSAIRGGRGEADPSFGMVFSPR